MHVQAPADKPLQNWQTQLLQTLADFFAVTLNLNMLGQRQARIALMEERAVIARELHDSLAQALSYQKVQLSLLKKQLHKQEDSVVLEKTFADLQFGLSAAYRQLRELLSTFRLKLDQPGLVPGIESTIEEFSRHSQLNISFENHIKNCPLTPNEEIHCLQIVREALSNVVKHANANNCQIWLGQDSQGMIYISIEDDGIGFDLAQPNAGHYGLSILLERSNSLAGQLEINNLHPGTRVQVQFMPQFRRTKVKAR